MRTGLTSALAAGVWLACAPASAQPSAGQDLFRAGPDTYAPRYEPGQPPLPAPFPLVPGIVVDDRAPWQLVAQVPARPPVEARGYLSLVVQPITAQIYVDGFFVGTVDDYRGSPGPSLEPGVHRVELRAEGYGTVAFDVRIVAGDVVTHRGQLSRVDAQLPVPPRPAVAATPPAAAPAAPRPRTFYLIPRCYAGDTPPTAAHLPAGCNLSDVRIVDER